MADFHEKWTEVIPTMTSSNSFGEVDREEEVFMTFILKANLQGPDDVRSTGCFEMYSSDERWYAEGGLWFKRNELVDFDGNYSLPKEFLFKLHEWGFDVESMAQAHKYKLEGE